MVGDWLSSVFSLIIISYHKPITKAFYLLRGRSPTPSPGVGFLLLAFPNSQVFQIIAFLGFPPPHQRVEKKVFHITHQNVIEIL